MRIKLLTIGFIIFGFIFSSIAQDETNFQWFKNRSFYKPFVSEVSAPINMVAFGVSNKNLPKGHISNYSFMEIHLGVEAPLFHAKNKNMKFSMTAPISLHVLWAPLEPQTAPIINNDYRFGLAFYGIKYLDNSFIKNISVKAIPFAHESTHLGDELTIFGINNINNFYRINVSYEYYELAFTINDPDTIKSNNLSFRAGFMGLINPTKGYYTYTEDETNNQEIFSSERWMEFYLELNYKKTSGFMTSKQWSPVVSIEARNRVKYDYHNAGKEQRVWCVNSLIGYDYTPKAANGKASIGHYIKYYRGLNYHGQLREFSYNFLGYAMVIHL